MSSSWYWSRTQHLGGWGKLRGAEGNSFRIRGCFSHGGGDCSLSSYFRCWDLLDYDPDVQEIKVSFEKQLKAGIKNAGIAGLRIWQVGDAEQTWLWGNLRGYLQNLVVGVVFCWKVVEGVFVKKKTKVMGEVDLCWDLAWLGFNQWVSESQDPKSLKKKGAGKNNNSKFIFLIITVNLSSSECIVISSYSNVFEKDSIG